MVGNKQNPQRNIGKGEKHNTNSNTLLCFNKNETRIIPYNRRDFYTILEDVNFDAKMCRNSCVGGFSFR